MPSHRNAGDPLHCRSERKSFCQGSGCRAASGTDHGPSAGPDVVTPRVACRLAWSVVALTFLFLALYVPIEASNPRPGEPVHISALYLFIVLTFPVVGALVASRERQNPIGWIFCGAGLGLAFSGFSEAYGHYALVARPGSLPAGAAVAWIGSLAGMLFFFPISTFLLLLFPTGRLVSSRWSPVAWASVTAIALVVVGSALRPGRMDDVSYLENPLGIRGPLGDLFDALAGVGWLLALACLVLSAVSLVARLRRSRGEERQQLKWLVYAASLLAVSVIPSFMAERYELMGLGLAALPLATGIAILRYRLYDIDLIINRTLVYGALTAVLGLAYYALVLLLQGLLSEEVAGSPLAVAGSTLAVAALFRPARARVQSFIDRRFYRARYNATKTLETFAARLRDEIDLQTLTAELVTMVNDTMQPSRVSVWLRAPKNRR